MPNTVSTPQALRVSATTSPTVRSWGVALGQSHPHATVTHLDRVRLGRVREAGRAAGR